MLQSSTLSIVDLETGTPLSGTQEAALGDAMVSNSVQQIFTGLDLTSFFEGLQVRVALPSKS